MIPRKIHYCWFSGEPFPEDIANCIGTWKSKLPEYEIVEWNTKNFNVNICRYTREAYAAKKYAFVSDYARLFILYHEGGIYLDSDIEVLTSFDDLLDNNGFTGFETSEKIAAWIFGSEKGNPIFKEFLEYYKDRSFYLPDGKMDLTPNPIPITNICVKHGLQLNDEKQELKGLTVYPMTYFCPWRPYESRQCFSDQTHTIHQFSGGWLSSKEKKRRGRSSWIFIHKVAVILLRLLGEARYYKLKNKLKI